MRVNNKMVAGFVFICFYQHFIYFVHANEFYIVYHRFNYPKGIKMGDSACFHREVCIDKLDFNADGSIQAVVPTHKGIVGVK